MSARRRIVTVVLLSGMAGFAGTTAVSASAGSSHARGAGIVRSPCQTCWTWTAKA